MVLYDPVYLVSKKLVPCELIDGETASNKSEYFLEEISIFSDWGNDSVSICADKDGGYKCVFLWDGWDPAYDVYRSKDIDTGTNCAEEYDDDGEKYFYSDKSVAEKKCEEMNERCLK